MMNEAPAEVERTVAQLAELHDSHRRATSRIQRIANHTTNALGRPHTLAIVLLVIVGWIAGNYVAARSGVHALEDFPFPDLAFVATVAALLIALAILSTQQHQDRLAEHRAELTLQIALLSERKMAKLIELLEEQRRDNPLLALRRDEEASSMAQPLDAENSVESDIRIGN